MTREFSHQIRTTGQISGSQFDDVPVQRAFTEAVADKAVSPKSGPKVEGGAIHIDGEVLARDGEVGDGNGRGAIGGSNGNGIP
jgi:hypothetical protein